MFFAHLYAEIRILYQNNKGYNDMAKCKCKTNAKIVSSVVSNLNGSSCPCTDVCASPICADPCVLGIMAPLIYDEIGINLCASFPLGVTLSTTYPTVTNATARVINASYTYGAGNVSLESINGRGNCYDITLSNITITFAVDLFDANCRLVATVYPTAVYLPPSTTAATYDADTNPSSVELVLFAPYGPSYETVEAATTPVLNFIGAVTGSNTVTQGINMFAFGKVLDLDVNDSTITVGLTLVLQSLYFAGYKVKSDGKIDIPKGSITSPENSDCMRFVSGNLLNLAIKPLDLGAPNYEEYQKQNCQKLNPSPCAGSCPGYTNVTDVPVKNGTNSGSGGGGTTL